MLNKYDISDEYENELIKRNLIALHNFLQKLNRDNDWENPHRYKITEYLPLRNQIEPFTQYELVNLVMDIENDQIVYYNDAEGILEENINNFRLQAFTVDSILYIGQQDKCAMISLEDGYIKIEY